MVVWDRLVRSIHWSVAALVLVDLVNEAGANPWHRWFGYAAGALVLVRLAWGLGNTGHARLVEMTVNAGRALPYARSLIAGTGGVYAGHNPLGALMAFALWTLILFVCVTGWGLTLDAFWGDDALENIHTVAAYILAGFAVLHVCGVLATSALYRTNLVKAMITGRKPPT